MPDLTGMGSAQFLKLMLFLKDKLDAEDYAEAREMLSGDEEDDSDADTQPSNEGTSAMDIKTVRHIQELRAAEEEVRPYVGTLMGMDSAGGVYKKALKILGHDTRDLPISAMKSAFAMLKSKPGRRPAADSKARKSFDEMFPNAVRAKDAS